MEASRAENRKPSGRFNLPYRFIQRLKALSFVEGIYLYGSRAKGAHSFRSDIDLAIQCPSASRKDWLKILEIVDEADTLLEIDCVRLDELRDGDLLKQRILQQGKTLYRKEASSLGT
jgi:predicted nucleotidyltransferase